MALQDEITRIKQAKADIKASIEAKGGSVGDGLIDTYASAIDNLPSGGGDIYEYFNQQSSISARNILKKIPMIDTTGCISAAEAFRNFAELEEFSCSDFSKVKNANNMCNGCSKLKKFNYLDTSSLEQATSMFASCSNLTKTQEFDTTKVKSISYFYDYCSALVEAGELKGDACTEIYRAFRYCSKLEIFGGIKNYGMAFATITTANNNFSTYDLSSCTKLTHDSLMNVINGLYDLNLTYDVANGGTLYTQKLTLGSTNKAKLTAEEIAIATNKGWTVA